MADSGLLSDHAVMAMAVNGFQEVASSPVLSQAYCKANFLSYQAMIEICQVQEDYLKAFVDISN